MSPASPPPPGSGKRFLFDGDDLSRVPGRGRHPAWDKSGSDKGMDPSDSRDIEVDSGVIYEVVARARAPREPERGRGRGPAGNRRVWRRLAVGALAGGFALAVAWLGTRIVRSGPEAGVASVEPETPSEAAAETAAEVPVSFAAPEQGPPDGAPQTDGPGLPAAGAVDAGDGAATGTAAPGPVAGDSATAEETPPVPLTPRLTIEVYDTARRAKRDTSGSGGEGLS